jgi:hypothetical protein
MELQSAACSTPLDQKFISQALHSHKKEVAKEFRVAFLSNCARTAARRGRARNQRPVARGEAQDPQPEQEPPPPVPVAVENGRPGSSIDQRPAD